HGFAQIVFAQVFDDDLNRLRFGQFNLDLLRPPFELGKRGPPFRVVAAEARQSWTLVEQIADEALFDDVPIELLPAEVIIAAVADDANLAAADLNHRRVERTTAQVVD